MKGISALRRRALLRGTALLVIVMAGLAGSIGSPSAARAASCTLSCYSGYNTNNMTNPNNGSVIHSPKVFLIFEGNWAASDMQAVKQYFIDVNGSAFEGILTQYYDSSGHISNTIAVSGSVMDPQFVSRDTCGTNTIVDAGPLGDISTEIADEGDSLDGSTINFVFTPPGYKVYGYNDGSCNQESCGYHAWYPGLPSSLIYAVIPWGGGPCNNEFPSGADPVLIDINTASHEQFEAITDPFGSGWFTPGPNGEIGDKCANKHPGIALSFGLYPLVQGEYSNASQSCEYPAMPDPVCNSSSSETQSLACDASLPAGDFNTVWLREGGPIGALSDPIDSWYSIPGGQTQDFVGGNIYWSSATGTHEVQGAIYYEYTGVTSGPNGSLGFPSSDELGIAGGRVSYFYGHLCGARGPSNSGSAIYWTSTTGAHSVDGCIYNKYWNFGGPNSGLNFPTSDEQTLSGGWVSYFYGYRCGGVANGPYNSGSAIYSSGGRTFDVTGCIYGKYQQLSGPGGMLGYPVSDLTNLYNSSGGFTGWVSYFAGLVCGGGGPNGSGSAIYTPATSNTLGASHDVTGCIYAKYQQLGETGSLLGYPVSDLTNLYNSGGSFTGWVSYFAGQHCGSGGPDGSGSAIYTPTTSNTVGASHEVHGCIYDAYQKAGGPTGGLGFPVSDEYTNGSGYRESDFQGGYITWNGQANVHFYGCTHCS